MKNISYYDMLLCLLNPRAKTQLHCDASNLEFGSILLQKQSDNAFLPIFYYSQRTTDVETRYHSFELEMLSIINSIKRVPVSIMASKVSVNIFYVRDNSSNSLFKGIYAIKTVNDKIEEVIFVMHN